MKALLSHAFVKRRRAKIASFISAALMFIPLGMPIEMQAWFAEQFPWAPSWACTTLSLAVAAWRIQAGIKATRSPS